MAPSEVLWQVGSAMSEKVGLGASMTCMMMMESQPKAFVSATVSESPALIGETMAEILKSKKK